MGEVGEEQYVEAQSKEDELRYVAMEYGRLREIRKN